MNDGPAEEDPVERQTYLVDGMTCEHCVRAVHEEVSAVAGVSAVEVDLASKTLRVEGSDIDDAAILAAVDEAGYQATARPGS
jgi:copper chaperone CopZ